MHFLSLSILSSKRGISIKVKKNRNFFYLPTHSKSVVILRRPHFEHSVLGPASLTLEISEIHSQLMVLRAANDTSI